MSQELPRNDRTILLKAAELIRKHGWCRGALVDRDGRLCTMGAIVVAGDGKIWANSEGDMMADFDEHATAAMARAQNEIMLRHGITESIVAYWNDRPERTIDEVLSVLEAAAIS